MTEWYFRSLYYTIGLSCISFGVSLMVISNLGVGPWDALFVGLAGTIGLSVGSWILIVGSLLIILNGRLLRRRMDFTAFITILILGVLIDFWLMYVFPGMLLTVLIVRLIILCLGITLIALGVALYLQADFAKNPIDNLMLAVQYRTGKSLTFCKTAIELTALILAFLIGGPIGLGTVLVAFFIGPLINLFYTSISKWKFLKKTKILNS